MQFPDDESVWDDAVQHYQGRYQCVCVTLPNCGGVVDRSWGFDFPEMLHMLKNTVDDVNATGAPMVVVAHDWGTAYARYPRHATWMDGWMDGWMVDWVLDL